MQRQTITIDGIPAILWGEKSEKLYLYVHGKMANKEGAEAFAEIAQSKGYQTLSFDLPDHGERKERHERCDIWSGMRDLGIIGEYARTRWSMLSLFACSIGAFFSLHAYRELPLQNCLFQSPIVNMEYLIGQMFLWSGVTPEQLRKAGEIDTPVDLLSWKYYQYVLAHPTADWAHPTSILYGSLDNLQAQPIIEEFAEHNHCKLTVAEGSEHPFMAPADLPIVTKWMETNA